MSQPTHSVTVLRAHGGAAMYKEYRIKDGAHSKRSAPNCAFFTGRVRSFSDLPEFLKIVAAASKRGDEILVRGHPLDELKMLDVEAAREESVGGRELTGEYVAKGERKPLIVERDGAVVRYRRRKALFDDAPLTWVMMDVDSYTSPHDWRTEPEQVIETLVKDILGEPFVGKECLAIWSSSHGIDDKAPDGVDREGRDIKVHLVFLLDHGVTSDQWDAWADANEIDVDKVLFRCVQPHFIATPRFKGDHLDPLKAHNLRRYLYVGEGAVPVEELNLDDLPTRTARKDITAADDWNDARNKPGWEGAFNRAFSLTDVLHEYLGEFWEVEDDGEHVTFLGSPTAARGNCMIYADSKLYASTSGVDWRGEKRNAYELCCEFLFDNDRDECDAWVSAIPEVREAYQSAMDEAFQEADQLDLDDEDTQEDAPAEEGGNVAYDRAVEELHHITDRKDLGNKSKVWRRMIVAGLHLDALERASLLEELFDHLNDNKIKVDKRQLKKAFNGDIRKAEAQKKRRDGVVQESDFRDIPLELADAYMEQCGGQENVIYANKRFYRYGRGIWDELEEGEIRREIVELVRDARKAAFEAWEKHGGAEGDENFAYPATAKTINEVTDLVRGHLGMSFKVFGLDDMSGGGQARENILICENTRLKLGIDGTLKSSKHRREDYALTRYPVNFDPEAQCPRIDQMMQDIFQFIRDSRERHAVIETVWELIGYAIQHSKRVPLWVLFKGPGKNGKSSLAKLLIRLMGVNGIVAKAIEDFESGKNKHAYHSLVGKTCLVDDDVDHNTKLPDGPLKKMCERKLMEADPKNRDPFHFFCNVTPMLLANGDPVVRDLSDGMRRRAVVIPLLHRFEQDGAELFSVDDLAQDEIDGAFLRALRGYRRFAQRGWKLRHVNTLETAKEHWLGNANPLWLFQKQHIERAPGSGKEVLGSLLFETYVDWYENIYQGDTRNMKGKRAFFSDIESMGIQSAILSSAEHRNAVVFKDIEVIAVSMDEENPDLSAFMDEDEDLIGSV